VQGGGEAGGQGLAAAQGLVPAGEVVAVLQRAAAEVVACVSEEDERALSSPAASTRQVPRVEGEEAGWCSC
jgi:hypothetical protein